LLPLLRAAEHFEQLVEVLCPRLLKTRLKKRLKNERSIAYVTTFGKVPCDVLLQNYHYEERERWNARGWPNGSWNDVQDLMSDCRSDYGYVNVVFGW
jgi:hypothetical protein